MEGTDWDTGVFRREYQKVGQADQILLMKNKLGRGWHTFQADYNMVLVKDLINAKEIKVNLVL